MSDEYTCLTHGTHPLQPECPFCDAEKSATGSGFPAGMVGYCSMGHPEIYSKDVVCPLCAHIAASAEKSAALEQEISAMHAEIEQLKQIK